MANAFELVVTMLNYYIILVGHVIDYYIILVGHVIATNMKCLNFLSDVTISHAPHPYREEMSAKSDFVNINCIQLNNK
jgi:hypothetical protein